MSTPWTKGPWVVTGKATIRSESDAPEINFDLIAKCNWRNAEANARLIASAPSLAEALQDAITIMDGMLNDERPTTLYLGESLYNARAALAMAGAK